MLGPFAAASHVLSGVANIHPYVIDDIRRTDPSDTISKYPAFLISFQIL